MTGQEFLELAQHGIHRAGMERVGCPDAANGNPCLGKTLAQCTDLVFGPGDHTVTRIVYRGQLDLRWQVLRDVIGAKSHRDHGTGRRLMHKAGAQRHRFDRCLQVEYAGQGGRDVFAGAVSDVRPGAHAESVDQLRERVFHREQRRLRTVNALKICCGPVEHFGMQVDACLVAESGGAGVEVLGEDRLGVIEPFAIPTC